MMWKLILVAVLALAAVGCGGAPEETVAAAGWYQVGPHGAGPAAPRPRERWRPEVEYDAEEPTTCGPDRWSLTHQWLAAGDERVGEPPRLDLLYWDVISLDHDAVRADLQSRHQYVVIVTLGLTCTYDLDD